MNEFGKFLQAELDQRGWKQAEFVRRSGLTRQHVSKLLGDKRPHIGQMPDDATIIRIALGSGIPRDVVRAAAARALAGYIDSGSDLTLQLSEVPTDSLLTEIRRRIDAAETVASSDETQPGTPGEASENEEAKRKVHYLNPRDQDADLDDPPPPIELADAARTEPGYIKSGERPENQSNE